MTTAQLLKILHNNRELIQRNNVHAHDYLHELNNDCIAITDEEVLLNLELNNSLAEKHFNSNHRKAIENSKRVIERFEKSTHQNLIVRHRWLIGNCYAIIGEFDEAEKYLFSAITNLVPDQQEFIPLKADILLGLTMNEQMAERGPQKSIQYLTEAIELLKDKDYAIRKANCLMGMGNVNINSGHAEEALKNYQEAAIIYEQKYDLANMASAYSNIGTCYIEMKDFEEAEKFLQKSLDMRLKVGSPENLSISYYNLALALKGKNNLDRAHELVLKSRDILISTGSKLSLAETEDLLADIVLLKDKHAATVRS